MLTLRSPATASARRHQSRTAEHLIDQSCVRRYFPNARFQRKPMQQRLHWALTITALVVALLGVTSLGSAAVNTGVAAAKAPLYASGLLTRGPRGPRGRRGLRGLRGPAGHAGPHGDAGDPGVRGPRGSAFVARARSVGTVPAPGNEPLTGNTWMQAAAEDDVVYGAITYQSPPLCTTSGAPPQLSVNVYVD